MNEADSAQFFALMSYLFTDHRVTSDYINSLEDQILSHVYLPQ